MTPHDDAPNGNVPHDAAANDGGSAAASFSARTAFDPKLIELLVCPYTRATLAYDAARQELISRPARLAYPIRDGVPILVREEARHLDDRS
jgi:uncharacterized protein